MKKKVEEYYCDACGKKYKFNCLWGNGDIKQITFINDYPKEKKIEDFCPQCNEKIINIIKPKGQKENENRN